MKDNSIRKKLEEEVAFTLFNILKKGGMYHYFCNLSSVSGCEANAREVYQDTIHLLNSIESIITTYPDDYKTILSGEFTSREFSNSHLEGLPLFVCLELAKSFCNKTRYPLSEEEMNRFQHVISVARNVAFSDKFNKNWHVSDVVYQYAGCDTVIQFKLYSEKENYQDKLGTHQFNSTIKTFNCLHYGYINEDVDSPNYLPLGEEILSNYDLSDFPELECDPIFVAVITNNAYKWGSWQTMTHTLLCPLFQEQEEELERRYEALREKIIASEKKKQYSNFTVMLPYFANTTLNSKFVLSENINWEENKDTKKMAQELEFVYYAAKEYYGKKEISFLDIMQTNGFDKFLKSINYTMQDFVVCEQAAKQEIVKTLVECYMSFSKFSKSIFRMKEKTKEGLEQKLMKLSLEDLYLCRGKVNIKRFGAQYIQKYINQYDESGKTRKIK